MNNCFEIKDIPRKGRSMVATKPIAAKETIFEEEPFISCQFSWNAAYGYQACDHCMRPLETTLQNVQRLANDPTLSLPYQNVDPTAEWVPQFTKCQRCKVCYCSEDCRVLALKRYHRVNCLGQFHDDISHPINALNTLWKTMHYPPETSTVMLIVRLMAMYKQTENKQEFLQTLQSFQSLTVNTEQKIYHKMLGENFEQQLESLFAAFCKAFPKDEFEMFHNPVAFKTLWALLGTNSQGIATSPFAEWVNKVTALSLSIEDKAQLDVLIDDLYKKTGEFAGEFLNVEGSGLYILQSKINHSCLPNAQSTFPYSNDIVVLKAINPIALGEEICISYIDDCQLERSRHSRQKILKENYLFLCECPKCKSQSQDPNETSEEEDDEMDMDDEDEEMDD